MRPMAEPLCRELCEDDMTREGVALGADVCVCRRGVPSETAVLAHEIVHAAIYLSDPGYAARACAGMDHAGHSYYPGDLMYPVYSPGQSPLSLERLRRCLAGDAVPWVPPRVDCPPGALSQDGSCFGVSCSAGMGVVKYGRGAYSVGAVPGCGRWTCGGGRGHAFPDGSGCLCLVGSYGERCEHGDPFDVPGLGLDALDALIVISYMVEFVCLSALAGYLVWLLARRLARRRRPNEVRDSEGFC